MNDSNETQIVIVGAGLAGALLATYFGRAGYQVEVFERRDDPRQSNALGGRSINLALSTRGISALKEVGVLETVMENAVRMPGRMMHSVDGTLTFQPYGKQGQAIHSVSRGGLNRILVESADECENVQIRFSHRLVDLDADAGVATFAPSNDGPAVKRKADLIIGCDGAYSAVRSRLLTTERFSYSIDYLDYGYKELNIPPSPDGDFQIEKHALHIWPRQAFMMIALPNQDGSFTVTCFWPLAGENSFERIRSEADVTEFFESQFPDALPLIPELTTDFFANPTSSLATVRCRPWTSGGHVVLVGDSAHAIVPFYGQGMNCAFEDCSALFRLIQSSNGDWSTAIDEYFENRKRNADAIADLALENFVEMRDHVGSAWFLWKKRGEKILHRFFPKWFVPLYTMISFTNIPYADAVERAYQQSRTLRLIRNVIFLIVAITALWLIAR